MDGCDLFSLNITLSDQKLNFFNTFFHYWLGIAYSFLNGHPGERKLHKTGKESPNEREIFDFDSMIR